MNVLNDCEMTCPNNCSCYHDQIWSTNVVDCGGQQTTELPRRVPMDSSVVYLDGNNFPVLKNHAFIGRKNLKALYVNSSQVAGIQNRTFAGLVSLQVLHLADNRLSNLNGYEFENLTSLRELYLQNNQLSVLENATLAPLITLHVLRLDGNRLFTLPILQLRLTQFSQMHALSLGRNQWSCRCQFLQQLTSYVADNALIVQDAQDIYCMNDDGSTPQKRELDFNATAVCTDYYAGGSMLQHGIPRTYIPLLAAIMALLFLLVVIIIVFVFRESLRIWLFAHYGVRVFGPRCEESEKLYDAVLLHSAKDSEFACQYLASELETGRPGLRICLQHRDLAHDATHYQLLEASRVSRRVIILLSRNFLQSEWSRCELRRAVHDALRGRPQKLVIIEEPEAVFEAESDLEMLPYLKTTAVQRIRRTDRHFWEKLRYALPADFPSFRGNNYTLEHNHERIKQPASPGLLYRQAPPPAYCTDVVEAAIAAEQNYSAATTATPSPRPHRHQNTLRQSSTAVVVTTSANNNATVPYYQPTGATTTAAVSLGYTIRPPSEHIYSSIDSDYSTLDNEHMMMMPPPSPAHQQQLHPQQHSQQQQHQQQQQQQWRATLQQQQQREQQKQQQREQITEAVSSGGTSSGTNSVVSQQGQHVQAYLV